MSPDDTTEHILVVDDDEVMGELLCALLSSEGYQVSCAGSAEEAYQCLGQMPHTPEVILCDINLPGTRGGELARTLAGSRRAGDLPAGTLLLGMSASAPKDEEAGSFDGFLLKPFSGEEFTARLQRIRAGKDQAREADGGQEGGETESYAEPDAESGRRPPLEERTFAQLRSKLEDGQLRELYEMTVDDVQKRVKRMAAAAQSGDAAAVRQEAHTIKGSCGMVGAAELQELAAATEGGSAVDTGALEKFDRACQRLRRMLEERL